MSITCKNQTNIPQRDKISDKSCETTEIILSFSTYCESSCAMLVLAFIHGGRAGVVACKQEKWSGICGDTSWGLNEDVGVVVARPDTRTSLMR